MFNSKPKGAGVMIALGVPKEPPRLGAPGGSPASRVQDQQRDPQAHEADESPEYEQQEEYGAKLLNDMIAPLTDLGLGEDEAKATLGHILLAAAKCLMDTGEERSEMAPDDEGQEYGR